MTGRQFQAHFAMDGKYAPTAPKVLTRPVHLMLFHSALTGSTPPSGAIWPLSGGGKWRTSLNYNKIEIPAMKYKARTFLSLNF